MKPEQYINVFFFYASAGLTLLAGIYIIKSHRSTRIDTEVLWQIDSSNYPYWDEHYELENLRNVTSDTIVVVC